MGDNNTVHAVKCFWQIIKILYEKYITWDIRRSFQWRMMVTQIKTSEQYERVLEAFFDDDIITTNRLLILKVFTKDLCKYHNNDAFWSIFEKLQHKPKNNKVL